MGVPDRESWLFREHYPTGTARGWRRTGCLVMLAGTFIVLMVTGLIAVIVAVS